MTYSQLPNALIPQSPASASHTVPQNYPWSVGNGASAGVFGGYSVPPGGTALRDERALLWYRGVPVNGDSRGSRISGFNLPVDGRLDFCKFCRVPAKARSECSRGT